MFHNEYYFAINDNTVVIIVLISFFSTEAVLEATLTGTIWLMVTVLIKYILPDYILFVVAIGTGVIFVILPIVNHIRIFFAIRRHNNQMQDAVSGQNLSAIFRWKRKEAIDMFIVIAVLMLCLAPAVVSSIFEVALGEHNGVVYVWTTTLLFVNSSTHESCYLFGPE